MGDMDLTAVILATLTLCGVIGGPYLALRQKRIETKAQNEAAKHENTNKLIEQLQAQVEELDKDLREARREQTEMHHRFLELQITVAEWEVGVRILSNQVIRLGENPDWKPPIRGDESHTYD